MPRPRNPQNETNRSAQERYRDRLLQRRAPESDQANAALSVAVAIYRAEAERLGDAKGTARSDALERLAARYLAAQGKDYGRALRAVRLRTRRLDAPELIHAVNHASEGDASDQDSAAALTPGLTLS